MEWNEEQIVSLIEQYHLHPNLWDARNPNYKKRNVKKESMRQMSAVLNVDSEEIERKLTVVLSQYRRARAQALKLKKSGLEANDIQRRVWFGFTYLTFLLDNDELNSKARKTRIKKENAAQSTDEDSFNEVSESESDDLETTSNNAKKISVEKQDEFDKLHKKIAAKQFKSPKKVNFNKNILKKMKKSGLIQIAQKRSQPRDECLLFGEYIASKLRKFDPVSRAQAEQQISKIVTNIEMRMLLSQQEGNNQPIYNTVPSSPITHFMSSTVSSPTSITSNVK